MSFARAALRLAISALVIVLMMSFFADSTSAQTLSVSATTPNAAAQGTINLNVTISGKGFKNGAKAQWFVTGTTNPGGVVVNSTAFVNSTTLTANITVSDTAVIANFDVQVTNADGRTGKGTELFAVTANGAGKTSCQATNILPPVYMDVCSTSGCLDSSYGGSTAPLSIATGYAVVEAPDGSIYGAGPWRDPVTLNQNWRVVKVHSDGSPDTSFGNNGELIFFTNSNGAFPRSIALQPNADPSLPPNIIVGGNAPVSGTVQAIVTRILPTGVIDTSFGTNGVISFPAPKHSGPMQVTYLLVDDNRRILSVTGYPAITRISPDGKSTDWSRNISVTALAFQTVGTDKRIVTASSLNGDFASYRLLNDSVGTIDTSYGVGGLATVDFCGTSDAPGAVAVDSHANVILVGSMLQTYSGPLPNNYYNFAAARLTPNGLLDTSFGDVINGQHSGKYSADVAGLADSFESVTTDDLDRIVISGNTNVPNVGQFGTVLRLNFDGTPDVTFGNVSQPSVLAYQRVVTTKWIFRQSLSGKYILAAGIRVLP